MEESIRYQGVGVVWKAIAMDESMGYQSVCVRVCGGGLLLWKRAYIPRGIHCYER